MLTSGNTIENNVLNCLLFADTIIFAESKECLTYLTHELQIDCYSSGLKINFSTTECMCMGKEDVSISIDDVVLLCTRTFKYLGLTI